MPPTPANLRYAERLVAEIKDKIRLGLYSPADYFPEDGDAGEPLTLRAQLATWLGAQRIEASTRAGYATACRFWEAALGDKAIKAIKHSDVLRVIAARPDLSGKTINNYTSVLREAFDLAIRDEIIEANPVDDVPRAAHQKPVPDPFDADELERIIEHARKHYPAEVANLLEFWGWTGLRTSELLALRWDAIDVAKRTATIREAVVAGVRKSSTKTATERAVLLNSRAWEALQRQRVHTGFGELVFLDPRYGEPWASDRAFSRSYWKPALRALGIRYRRQYNLRHTYATAMLMAGMTPAFAARQLGHSVEMFLRTYSRWLDGAANDLEMARLESALSGRIKPALNPESKTGT